jgi:hypothetical protein
MRLDINWGYRSPDKSRQETKERLQSVSALLAVRVIVNLPAVAVEAQAALTHSSISIIGQSSSLAR